ncbi:probable cytochrome P450 313a4 [Calliphora vicina]|uniref:probable cytochrome P450 313a4 n=1 Tax=Calliphora vicina TaxID=7373 RepID=UPI00325B2FAC
MDLILFAIASIVFAWIINRWNSRAFVRLAYKVPSNRLHTFLGWGKLLTKEDILSHMYEYGNKYGPNSVFWVGPFPFFLSSDPQILKDILTSKNCIDKPPLIYKGFFVTVGDGLINENEPHWHHHRKILNKAFSHKNLSSFVPLFNKEINSLIQQIQKSLEKAEDVDTFLIFRSLTINMATKTVLKRDLDQTDMDSIVMSKNAQGVMEILAENCFNTIMSISWIRKLAEISVYKTKMQGLNIFKRLINESVDILEKNRTTDPSHLPEVNSALEYALNGVHQNSLAGSEILPHMLHLFAASFETTSSTLFLVVTMLAMHPEYQQYAYEEVINILPDDDNTDITLEQVDQLMYLEMVLNETLRVCPVVPMVFRKVSNEDLTLSNGLTLPVGQIISIDLFSLHRRKDIWGTKADDFNPDNFLPSNVNARHPFSFIPFTKGQRFCIGWRYALIFVKISLAKLIKTYKFSTDFKYKDLKFENHISLKLVEDPQVHMEQRKAGV